MHLHEIVAQLLAFPLGKPWARVIPNVKPRGASLNPGPLSLKGRRPSLRLPHPSGALTPLGRCQC
jgi:hypothetical protein